MTPNWKGVFPALTTQFTRDQELDLEATAQHIEVLLASGVTGIIMLGSLGENVTLSPDEKRQVMRTAIEVTNGRVPVLSGVAETSTRASVQSVQEMEKLGEDRVMVWHLLYCIMGEHRRNGGASTVLC